MRENRLSGCMSKDSCSVQRENNPLGKGVRIPIAGIAGRRETKVLKSIDGRMESMRASLQAATKVNADMASKVRSPGSRVNSRMTKAACAVENLTKATDTVRRG